MTTKASSKSVDALMAVCGIGKVFGDQQVLADVSFEVASGEILGLIGPNGAGKTTLLECIAGLLAADTGAVRWRSSLLPRARRKERLFYVPEAISPYPDQRTAEVLTFFRQAHRQPPSRLEHLVSALDLEPALAKPLGALSKGYRRRLRSDVVIVQRIRIGLVAGSAAVAQHNDEAASAQRVRDLFVVCRRGRDGGGKDGAQPEYERECRKG